MRHRNKVKKLGRTKSHRKATLRNLALAILTHHQIKTTLAKAKAARSVVERLITYGKKDTVHARRLAFKFLQSRDLVKKLFDEIAPTFSERDGGYTRIIKLGQRAGDGAQMAVLQLVGFEEHLIEGKEKTKKKAKKKPKEEPKLKEKAPAEEPKKEVKEKKKPTAKKKAAKTAAPKKAAEETKPVEAAEKVAKEKAEVAEPEKKEPEKTKEAPKKTAKKKPAAKKKETPPDEGEAKESK